ncbi:hypothetical protein BH23CHL2_BH23CHL2_23460 [soil metagenome]
MFRGRLLFAMAMTTLLMAPLVQTVSAGQVLDVSEYTYRTWARTDLPIVEGVEARTWMWGPEPFAFARREAYSEAPGGDRYVEYYDKARMEVTNPNGDPNSIWYVTNGLLVVELITGRMQVGDDDFVERDPAFINVAGDSDDIFGITYSMLDDLLDAQRLPMGDYVTWFIEVDGSIVNIPSFEEYGVFGVHVDPVTNHTIPWPFWDFMNSSGTIYADGSFTQDQLFADPLFATGRPITEAYWVTVKVAGNYKDVLLQCFERRCLTYTPDNPEGWQVEAGNVGLHYHEWRYEDSSPSALPEPGDLIYGSDLTDWPTGAYEDGLTYVDDGVYGMHAFADSVLLRYLDPGNAPFTDFWVDLEVRLVSEPDPESYACLMARLDPLALEYSYDFCLGADGTTFAFYDQYNPDYTETLLPLERRARPAHPNDWVLLSIVARGEALWFLVDDQLVGSTTFTGPAGGTIGFYVLNPGATSVEFEFRDLYVWEVE